MGEQRQAEPALRAVRTTVGAAAESFHGLYKAELGRHAGPWGGLDDLERAAMDYVPAVESAGRLVVLWLGVDPAGGVQGAPE